ncbi:TPA: hypothetical protein N0F65_012338 [Lagenidium giganteum]|uniref:Uncharacterized protein n=1 Tax=Lagenidium giganteum TaxID=4803 RepID=A0AAV2YSQ1_9STRA|nr:TPA: hypothetical protein N0F65_012338 [Lagenidium giganteum]
MKRSLDQVSGGGSVSQDDVVVRPSRRCSGGKRQDAVACSPQAFGNASPTDVADVEFVIHSRLRRRTNDLEVCLREEGLIRLIFTFLDVREHQMVKSCCRAWKKLIQTLSLDVLDLTMRSPVNTLNLDRAFVAIMHNYSRVHNLDLTGQRSLADRDLLVLASCFWSELEHITVDDCLEVTDFGLLAILNAQSQRLQSVSMRHCKQITGSFTKQQITGRHPSLVKLDFHDTRVSYALVNDLESVFPSLTTIVATHTPAHLEFFQAVKWGKLLDELRFVVTNEMSDLPFLNGLLDEFDHRRSSMVRSGSEPLNVLARSLLTAGRGLLLNVPLHAGELLSPVLYACENGLIKVLPVLLAASGVDLEVTDKDGTSPLCMAVTNGLTDAVRLLIQSGADINKRTYCLATPLYIASEMDWDDVIDLLLEHGAQTDCAVMGGATALCVAAKNGNRTTVLRLLSAAKLKHKRFPLPSAREQMQFVQALFLSCERGHVDIVEDILNATHVDANVLMDNSVTPLYLACQMGHDAVVELLLQRGADPNFRRPNGGVSCLYIAAQEGKTAIVERLVRAKVSIHAKMEDLSTALHIAARMGHIHVAAVLLREGAYINDQTRSGLTPLYIAAEEGHLPMVQFFLEHYADLNKQTKNGTTPLFVASQKGHAEVVRALLIAGANAQLPKNNGTYPMDAASLLGNYEVTKLLLQYGARVGGLSLHFAERRRDLKLQALLMDRYYAQHFEHVKECAAPLLS